MVYSKPERSSQTFEFRCVWKSFKEVLHGKIGEILTDGKVDFIELPRKHSGARTHLKMIDQPSGVLEYDAVGAIDHKFREAVSYNMYESAASCAGCGTYHAKSSAHTGTPHPNISTIFIGRSNAEELECSDIPKSADPASRADSTFECLDVRRSLPRSKG
jgi:hypothetical protein